MAKKIDKNNLIHVELTKLENKVKEFQDYLEQNPITHFKGVRLDEADLTEKDQDKQHKEILVQIKMQDALFVWLPLLEKLKEGEESKGVETRGNIEINGMFKNKDK